jgi:hypothetical protein
MLYKTHTRCTVLSTISEDVSIGLLNILHLPASIPNALSAALLPLLKWKLNILGDCKLSPRMGSHKVTKKRIFFVP